MSKCAICGGKVRAGRTTVTVDTGVGVVVVRRVAARVCTQCGEDWLDDRSASEVEKIVQAAKSKGSEVEVVALAPA